jgi:hypothetical protein
MRATGVGAKVIPAICGQGSIVLSGCCHGRVLDSVWAIREIAGLRAAAIS